MRRKNRFYLLLLIVTGIFYSVITGCSSFDQISSAPMVKVKCKEKPNTEQKSTNIIEQRDSSENRSPKLSSGLKHSFLKSVLAISGGNMIKKAATINFPVKKSGSICSRKSSVLKNSHAINSLMPSKAKQSNDISATKSYGEGGAGLFSLIFLLLAVGAFLGAIAFATPVGAGYFLIPIPNPGLLILSIASAFVSFVLSIIGLFSYDDSDRAMAIIVFAIWILLILLILIG